GYIALFKKLYKIKKQHKKEQKIYQQTIQVFPQLKYPSLEACSDYEQALRYKFHLSYMLGEVLIKAYQTWYTGGGFKLKNNIKKANKEFQIFREIFKEFDQINSSILEGLIDNKQLFLKEFSRIKNILKIHQDYKAILDNIFHNFNYFIQNFDLIEEWLLSDDFKERYKKENHPYPSLLDPKKLNDKNEKINYHNIPAELAWEMNLPLPDNYEFVVIAGHSIGFSATLAMLYMCGAINDWGYVSAKNHYEKDFNMLIDQNCTQMKFISITEALNINDKYLSLIKAQKALILTRDPISHLLSWFKHTHTVFKSKISTLNIEDDLFIYDDIVKRTRLDEKDGKYFTNFIYKDATPALFFRNDVMLKLSPLECFCLKFEDIAPKNIVNTFSKLKDKLKLQPIDKKNKEMIESYKYATEYGYFLPVNLIVCESYSLYIATKESFYFPAHSTKVEVTELFEFTNKPTNLMIFVEQDHIHLLHNDKNFSKVNIYLQKFIDMMEQKVKSLYTPNEQELFDFLRQYKEAVVAIKDVLDKELFFMKKMFPNIVASWKYYQEFEKMCKELDSNI
ncbi:TPA: DUF2972 domain-containing protein, partial [Campylobacter jejuni]|nr:DUF2972 domain-containing protein [Campylobacter jejuni]ECB9755831.1 DUF2972 domain-containing protein [Campylobacter jejuni]HEF1677060.1 DUF2972 domain-containing protein [Campylobacter jejuni]